MVIVQHDRLNTGHNWHIILLIPHCMIQTYIHRFPNRTLHRVATSDAPHLGTRRPIEAVIVGMWEVTHKDGRLVLQSINAPDGCLAVERLK